MLQHSYLPVEDGASVLDTRIRQRAGRLTPKLREAAEFVRVHQAEVASRSLRQVARTAGVTPTTLSRLARALGYPRYESLRDDCREALVAGREGLAERARRQGPVKGPPVPGAALQGAVDSAVRSLEGLRGEADGGRLERAVRVLLEARRVALLGAMSSASMVDYLGHMTRMAFAHWHVVSHDGAAETLATLGRGDALLVVSLAPYARITLVRAEFARRRGATLIAITDRADSPLLPLAGHAFLVSTEGDHFFPSHAAVLVLLETIVGMLVREAGPPARRRIARVESANQALGEYLAG
jgi:DNA-binding MurR/RpiR family transcriptional regulator